MSNKHINSDGWRKWVWARGETIIKKTTSPLLLKEMAWRAIKFAKDCDISNPISYALRPLAMHRNLRLAVGLNLAVMAVLASVWGPIPSLAQDTGGVPAISVLPVTQVSLSTQVRVRFPLPHREVSQGFWLLHPGVDLRTPVGTPVTPIMAGVVAEIESGKTGYGNKIVVDHENGYKSLYAHLSQIKVAVGDRVTTDNVIGKSGNTGRSTGPHLHLEVWNDGKKINPLLILDGK